MTLAKKVLTTVLAASLATVVLAASEHHAPSDTAQEVRDPHGGMGDMHGPMMEEHRRMMAQMHGMMARMHEMMAQMHEAPPAGRGAMMHGGSTSMPTLDTLSGEEFEVAFLSMMIAHHEGAIGMAAWILERSEDADVRAAAEAIADAQDPEIQQMTAWLREWYDSEIVSDWAEMMGAEMGAMMDAMEQGDDPDVAFLTEMIRHHQGAIDMAQIALERATHAEVRELARDVIVVQADEVHQYRTWLADERAE